MKGGGSEAGRGSRPGSLRWRSRRLDSPAGPLVAEVAGPSSAPLLLLLPALGRDGRDFDGLSAGLSADFQLARLDWRGSGKNVALAASPRLDDYLGDCLALLDALRPGEPAWILGATFGNRVARRLAARYPARCAALVLLAAGGDSPPEPQATALARCFMARLTARRQDISCRQAGVYFGRPDYFERQPDPVAGLAVFLAGWWPACLPAQRVAARSFAEDAAADRTADIAVAGKAGAGARPSLIPPSLIIQGLADRLAPPENGRRLAAALAPSARLVEIPDAGHLLALEQPRALAQAILAFKSELEN